MTSSKPFERKPSSFEGEKSVQQDQSKAEGPKKITVEKQIENLEPFWRFGGRLAGERSESSNAGETESENITHSSNLYGTDSVVSEPTNSLQFRMASLSGKATKNNGHNEQPASS